MLNEGANQEYVDDRDAEEDVFDPDESGDEEEVASDGGNNEAEPNLLTVKKVFDNLVVHLQEHEADNFWHYVEDVYFVSCDAYNYGEFYKARPKNLWPDIRRRVMCSNLDLELEHAFICQLDRICNKERRCIDRCREHLDRLQDEYERIPELRGWVNEVEKGFQTRIHSDQHVHDLPEPEDNSEAEHKEDGVCAA
ncbi:hypothetical protein HK101_011692 [Irineochytrium annulatum]|nr:hypothetical protein HK101_011692 [Irineochytrium annulatum]